MRSQLLLIDADDTLWENNVYFERAIAHYMDLFAAAPLTRAQIRARINREERATIARMGYGLKSFCEALTRAHASLLPDAPGEDARLRIAELAQAIASEPIELLPQADATLAYLAGRHRLALMTKGDFAEQSRKIELSGLARFFEQIHIVPEKNSAQYRAKLRLLGGAAADAWMIGNSPRSDINPALAAGLNAVFIPHPQTWILEQDAILAPPAAPPRLLRLEQFSELQLHF